MSNGSIFAIGGIGDLFIESDLFCWQAAKVNHKASRVKKNFEFMELVFAPKGMQK